MPRGGRSSRSPTPSGSSSGGGSAAAGGGGSMLTRKPATHPDENTPQHKANLVRNLGRNDAEIAAIVQCNRSLRTLRDDIRERCGEATLLDVGEGTIRLKTGEVGGTVCPTVVRVVPGAIVDADGYRKLIEDRMAEVMKERALRQGSADANAGSAGDDANVGNANVGNDEASAAKQSDAAAEDAAIVNAIPPDEVPLDDPDHESDPTNPHTRTNLIRAFLLRLHLRRRLLNRLFRRMNRLSRAMDGESAISSGLNGPTPPRYGDFRFLLDEAQDEFRAFEAQFQGRVEARRNVEGRRALRRNKELGLVGGDDDDDDDTGDDAAANAKKDGDGDEAMADADTAEAKPEDVDGPTSTSSTSSSSPSDAAIAKLILPEEDVDDLNVLMETDVGRDKLVTYQDLTKPLQALGGGGGSPTKSKTPAAAASAKKKTPPSSKMDVAAEETAAKTEAVAADIDAEAAGADGGAKTEGPPSAIEVKAEATEESNGVANNGTSDAPAAVKADDDDDSDNKKADEEEEEELPPLPELVPGKIRKIVTLPLASSDPGPEERDFASSKFTAAGGGGIGAFNRSMNSREREVEFNRWKTDVLAKVPEQPTFAELGLENRVFGLEARRKKAAEVAAAAGVNSNDKMEMDNHDEAAAADDEDSMDVDDEGKSRKRSADDADEGNEEEKKEGGDNGADKAKEAGKEKIKRPDIFKKKKLISLAAAPSFHMQDQHRVREVHKELLVRSRYEKTQKMVEEANAAYNKAYAVSTEVHNRKNQRTNELNLQSTRVRMVETNANGTHQATTSTQRALWQKAYEQWCSRRMKAGLAVPPMPIEQQAPAAAAATASQNGNSAATSTPTSGADTRPSAVNGTPLTAAKSSDSAATAEEREAASALGAVVDKIAKEEGGGKKNPAYNDPSVLENVPAEAENFPAFTVPPMNADLAAAIAKERQKEAALRKQVTDDTIRLNAAEEERKKAWRQMLKLKGEMQTAAAGGSAGSGSRSQRRRPAASRRAPAPAPAAATYRAPAPAARAPAATAAYAGHSAVYGQAQQVQQNYTHSQAAMAAYQAHASAAGAARAPAAPANYYGYGYPQQQQQQYVPTQQTSRPGMPTAPTGTMAMAAAVGAAATAPTAAAVQQPPQQQQVSTQAAQQALAAYQAQQPQAQIATPAGAAAAATSTTSVTHQQRYSQEAIRNRTYGDGSVAPAVPPKRDGNGLFQRPSGRSRKGMDWDAVHGVWRPSLGGDMSQ